MNKKILGIISLMIGIYLTIVVPILSLVLNRVYSSVPVDPLTYFGLWLTDYGSFVIFLAVIGVIFIIIGYDMLRKNRKD